MVKDRRWQIYPNIVQCLTLTLVDCHRKCHLNRMMTQNKWPINPEKGTWWCGVWTHVCPHCSLWWSSLQWHTDLISWQSTSPLHNPIDWLRLPNKRIGTPTLSSSLWFVIPLNYKMFRNSIEYNESIETPIATLAPSFVKAKESALKYVCNSSNNDSRIALLTSSTSIFLGARMLRYIKYVACLEWRWWSE